MNGSPLSMDAFVERLREEGSKRYHDRHSVHQKMHAGLLSKNQIQGWVLNRYYYQTRIPIKDAILISKSDDPAFRRSWIRRIHDHDGLVEGEGGLAQWIRLGVGVGLTREEIVGLARVLPAVRFACDAYVAFVRERSLLEAVASSLTEFFSPEIMKNRLDAWEKHYPWVDPRMLEYFRGRVTRARVDSQEALGFVVENATTRAAQERCVAALVTKCEILWALLDAVSAAYPDAP
jgi:pyrroloquinoline-quinone synthase